VPNTLPNYDDLPVDPNAPKGSSWGLWGPDDVFGCLNLLTPERVQAGLACASEGRVFNLNLELELPQPPLFNRKAFDHVVHGFGIGHDDELVGYNTQSSSQWDGFRHIRHPEFGFYNNVADEEHGIHYWARRGIAGRAVLVDVDRWRASVGRPIEHALSSPISVKDLAATLESQRVDFEPGDVLLIRTGWVQWYRTLDQSARDALAADSAFTCCGLARGRAMARYLWDLHPAAVAADNPALEVWPIGSFASEERERWASDPEHAAETMLHFSLLGLLGIPIGELFDLDGFAEHCAGVGRYDCLFTSAPLNLLAGVGTPPNALAIV
jgi:hypothetical protein